MPSSVAGTYGATYTGASPGGVGVQCNDYCGALPGSNLGGYNFGIVAGVPTSVTVSDSTGSNVFVTVCQDTNVNAVCGEAGEPRINGCGGTVSLAGGNFVSNAALTVFVYSTNAVAGCIGTATTGTIIVTTT